VRFVGCVALLLEAISAATLTCVERRCSIEPRAKLKLVSLLSLAIDTILLDSSYKVMKSIKSINQTANKRDPNKRVSVQRSNLNTATEGI
jgi:hypothetical protein